MPIKGTSGSNIARPRFYNTVMVETIEGANAEERYFNPGELSSMAGFFNDAQRRLAIVQILTTNAEAIVSRAAGRIFTGGSPMAFSVQQANRQKDAEKERVSARVVQAESEQPIGNEVVIEDKGGFLERLKSFFSYGGAEVETPGFRPIPIAVYGPERMQKSLRDLDWFLRYVNYSLVAGDSNMILLNCLGLREILEKACSIDATIVAVQEMRRAATGYLKSNDDKELVGSYFDVIIRSLNADKSDTPADVVRPSSPDRAGLVLPAIYALAGQSRPAFKMSRTLTSAEKERVVRAAYRQVFERDILAYGQSISYLDSKVKNGEISVKEFIRLLGKSELYRKQFFEPFINSRVLELAFKHFLGRAPESRTEVQNYYSIVAAQGLGGLVDALVDGEEYGRIFGEDTVPFIRDLGQEAQPSWNWGAAYSLYNYAAPRRKVPQFITLYADYVKPLPNQHPYGSGNDPLEIQFGAIFKSETKAPSARPAPIGKDVQRILIRSGNPITNERGNPAGGISDKTSLSPQIFKLTQDNRRIRGKSGKGSLITNAGAGSVEVNVQAVIRAAYQQVFGRQLYEGQHLSVSEIKLENGEISVKEFVRDLATSEIFRKLYWQNFYVCKSIEYIHRRLLGRPTYGRDETNRYYDLAFKKGFAGVVNAILDTMEYAEVFGDDVVPYERYVTPAGLNLRKLRAGTVPTLPSFEETPKFIEKGTAPDRALPQIRSAINQGVSKKRDQRKIFSTVGIQTSLASRTEFDALIRAAYRQVFERDMDSYRITEVFSVLETKLRNREITTKEFIQALASSDLYRKQFFEPYPPTKNVELSLKHLLGRATKDQAELRKYNQIIATQGFKPFINAILDSKEYGEVFGDGTVPYNRYPTLPAANFPNTEILYNQLTKQSAEVVVPSFKPVTSPRGMDMSQTPLMLQAMGDIAEAEQEVALQKPLFIQKGKALRGAEGDPYTIGTRRSPKPIFWVPQGGTNPTEFQNVIRAAYRQVFERDVPDYQRLSYPESRLKNGEISMREFIRQLAESDLYRKQFYEPYPNTKVIELLTKHFLGRAPQDQAEIQRYNRILAGKGLKVAIEEVLNSDEYTQLFGEDVVPFKRYPTLPTGTYLASVATNDEMIQQSGSSYSPSYAGYSYPFS
ncbi:phycobilisome rod-core linker polypeptide [Anthocerotibacter panamensis]|uniref:ApcE n=1 Tax=Anthocerotibacter panamensis TaxID=2857077 RepID=A0AAJ6N6E4_9CYAN|nr:phycobilisome rod-core linker polypeptide [Anthocerotibacter panamensis]8IMI_0 Chain 0, ApcE [Anthocerotibacter panamensis]8IMJ_0 Chain 0, ApcE [Anthocerotibacter panamensis]